MPLTQPLFLAAAQSVVGKPEANELPRLRGSDKQVEWATGIRAKFIGHIGQLERKAHGEIAVLSTALPNEKAAALIREQEAMLALFERAKAKTESWWWIDRRNNSISRFLEVAATLP